MAAEGSQDQSKRIVNVELDEATVVRRSPEVEHERAVAIYDLIEENHFVPHACPDAGPYNVRLGVSENRMILDVMDADGGGLTQIVLPLAPFRRIVRDYFMVCESYYAAIKTSTLSQIEAIDMGRRGLHNEGAEMLRERMAAHAFIDTATARRLFTLLCVLHIRG